MSRKKIVFDRLQKFLKEGDYTSINHILQWEYKQNQLFELKNDEGLTLVHIACLEGNLKCLDSLLRNGGNVHIKSSVGWFPLHAATLGGKLEIVSYLLTECSADPLATDDMGCVASDLTVDNNILSLLNKHTRNATIKRDIEALASQIPVTTKRRTHSFNDLPSMPTKPTVRTQSMFMNKEEALKIRVHYVGSNSLQKNEEGNNNNYLQIPSLIFTDMNNNTNSNITRSNSDIVPSTKKTGSLNRPNSLNLKDVHNAEVIRQKSNSSSGSPNTPKAFMVFIRDASGRSREIRNRDSGVFDDDLDLNEHSLRKNSNDHYNVI